jgi:GT2 family glycosyltransferase
MAARHEVILFLDADILVPAGLIREVLAAVQEHGPRAMVFVPRRDVTGEGGRPCKPARGDSPRLSGAYMRYAVGGCRQPLWARQTSHCFAAAQKFLRSAGGWDVRFVGWGEEDTELFYRLWRMGGKIVTLRGVTVSHLAHPVDHEANFDSFSRNARYFMEKHPEVARARRSFYRHFGIL